jgi:indole-3-glycerol phosphate synthase
MKHDFLERILEIKRFEVEERSRKTPERELREAAEKPRDRRPFLEKLTTQGPHGINIIAEIKRGSPSRGLIRPDLDTVAYARSYENGGAAAISVLTDETFFHGSAGDLQQARVVTRLPVLRKDFVISIYQLFEAAAWGADAVLLIVRALSRELLQSFLQLCSELDLDALVEVHSEDELDEAARAGARIIGINNRDLSSFTTDIQTSIRIARYLEADQIAVAESGIHGREQIDRLLDAGIWNFLIGESLVQAEDPVVQLRQFLGK